MTPFQDMLISIYHIVAFYEICKGVFQNISNFKTSLSHDCVVFGGRLLERFFSSILYIITKNKWSLQAVLREIITTTQTAMQMVGVDIQGSSSISTISVRMATIMVSTVPILIVYPFIQKYFVKGALIGSIKG